MTVEELAIVRAVLDESWRLNSRDVSALTTEIARRIEHHRRTTCAVDSTTSALRAEALAHIHELATPGNNVSAVLRELVADLRNAQQRCIALEHAGDVLAIENADAKDAILRQAARIAALESELATLQASVVDALSGAGPEVGEDERTA